MFKVLIYISALNYLFDVFFVLRFDFKNTIILNNNDKNMAKLRVNKIGITIPHKLNNLF